jgi:hypothetical protein
MSGTGEDKQFNLQHFAPELEFGGTKPNQMTLSIPSLDSDALIKTLLDSKHANFWNFFGVKPDQVSSQSGKNFHFDHYKKGALSIFSFTSTNQPAFKAQHESDPSTLICFIGQLVHLTLQNISFSVQPFTRAEASAGAGDGSGDAASADADLSEGVFVLSYDSDA